MATIRKRGRLIAGVSADTSCSGRATRSPARSRASTSTCCARSRGRIFGRPDTLQLSVITAAERLPLLQNGERRHRRAQHDDQLRPLGQDRLLRRVLPLRPEGPGPPRAPDVTGRRQDLAGKKVCAPDGHVEPDKLRDAPRPRPSGPPPTPAAWCCSSRARSTPSPVTTRCSPGWPRRTPTPRSSRTGVHRGAVRPRHQQEQRRLRAVRQRRARADARRRRGGRRATTPGSPRPGQGAGAPAAGVRAGAVISAMDSATAPVRPVGSATPWSPQDRCATCEALGTWRDERKAELDVLDEAALGAWTRPRHRRPAALDGAVEGRRGPLRPAVATWDSGRVGPTELERLSTLVWGRLDATNSPRLAVRCRRWRASPSSLPEACRLSDALAASLRARLGSTRRRPTSGTAASAARPVERVRDLVDREPAQARAAGRRPRAARRPSQPTSWPAPSGAPTRRPAGAAGARRRPRRARPHRRRLEPARRRPRRGDGARTLRAELEARGAALRDLAARCVARSPRLPGWQCPTCRRSGPCPPIPLPWTPTWCGSTPSAGR